MAGRALEHSSGRGPGLEASASASLSSAGAFFIPYFIFFFTCGIPVFFLEVALGQYTSQGSVTAWRKICPLLQGECSRSPSCPPLGPASRLAPPLFLPFTASFIHPLSSLLSVAGDRGSIIRLCGAQSLYILGRKVFLKKDNTKLQMQN